MRLLLVLILAAVFSGKLAAQPALQGTVIDPSGNPLAFVTVLLNDKPGKGVLTDIEGRFSLDPGIEIESLGFRYVGYKPLRVDAGFWEKTPGEALRIVLEPTEYALPEAIVHAGENPADVLIRKAIALRKDNNPEMRHSYTCKTYNKASLDALPRRAIFEEKYAQKDSSDTIVQADREKFDRLEKNMELRHAFLMESVTERSFLSPNQVQEKVLLNRVSGFTNAGMVALANMVQPFSFYGDYLTILDKNYVNPISPGSPNLYFFQIEDTLYAEPDTIWVISFHPRRGKVFEGLEGVLHLNSKRWAIQNVLAQPAQQRNLELKIEQAYQFVPGPAGSGDDGGGWFPEQLNFEMEFKKYPAEFVGIRSIGHSYITDVSLDAPVRVRDFNPEMPLLMTLEADNRSDSAWARWRALNPLTSKDLNTYKSLDSIGKVKNFDRLSRLMDIMVTGRLPIKGSIISLNLQQVIKFNDYEGARLGVSLSNAQARPLLPQRRFELGAYVGYGFRDGDWKYGGYGLWRLNANGQTQLRLGWRRDLLEPGATYELPPTALVNRSLYASRMDRVDEYSAALSTRLGRFFALTGSFRQQNLEPGYAYQYGMSDIDFIDRFRFREATLFLRYANGARSNTFFGSDIGTTQRLPVLELAYTRGLWQGTRLVASSTKSIYERWTAAIYQSFFLGRLGRTRWRLEVGWATEDAPLAKLFTLNQSGGGFNIFVLPNTFQALPDTVFLANQYVNFYFAQEIGPVLYQRKRSAPSLSLLQHAAWGSLKRPELHHGLGFRNASPALLESGIQLDNLLRINYFNTAYFGLGGAVFYRWGGLAAANWSDNFSFRATLRFEL